MVEQKRYKNGIAAKAPFTPANRLFYAYELGQEALMVGYCHRYLTKFEDFSESRSRYFSAMDNLTDAIAALAPAIRNTSVRTEMQALMAELYKSGQRRLDQVRNRDLGLPTLSELDSADVQWRRLAELSKAAFEDLPTLRCWSQLGRSTALLYLDALDEQLLPHFSELITAARALPTVWRERIPMLGRLGQHRGRVTERNVLRVFNLVLGREVPSEFDDDEVPVLAGIRKLAAFDNQLKEELRNQSGGRELLVYTAPNAQAVLDGQAYALKDDAALVLAALQREAVDKRVTAAKLAAIPTNQLQYVRRLDRVIEGMPEELQSLIDRKDGWRGGMQLRIY